MDFYDAIRNGSFGDLLYESEILTTTAGQRYKLTIHRYYWYAVHAFVEIDPRLAQTNIFEKDDEIVASYKISDEWSYEAASRRVEELSRHLSWSYPPNFQLFTSQAQYPTRGLSDVGSTERFPVAQRVLDTKAAKYCKFYAVKDPVRAFHDPDSSFVPGDHIQVKRLIGYHHAAIYLGNRKVIELADPQGGLSKKRAQVAISDWSIFHLGDSQFSVCLPRLKVRANHDVIQAAKTRLGDPTYHTLSNNCQHFATWAQFGDGFHTEHPSRSTPNLDASVWQKKIMDLPKKIPTPDVSAWQQKIFSLPQRRITFGRNY